MATLTVANQVELEAAIRSVRGGDTILLKAGTYADLNLTHSSNRNYKFTEKVTIKSADPTQKAVVNELFIRGAANVTISDLKFDYTGVQGAGTQSWQIGDPFFIENAAGVTLDRLVIDGHSNSAGFGSGTGLRVKNSTDVTVSNTEMLNFKVAMNLWNSSNLTIEQNVIRKMNHDALFVGGVKNLVVEDNYIGDYNPQYPLALHKDAIQIFTDASTAPSENVAIRGNTIVSSDVRHGVFIFNELYRDGNTSDAVRHKNILVEDNYIRSANTHAVTVTHADGVTVRGNTVTLNGDKGLTQIPLINVSGTSQNVEIIGNRVSSVQDSLGDSWIVYGNDVDSRSRFHWDGVYVNGVLQPQVQPTAQDPSLSDRYFIDRSAFDGTTPLVIDDLDFAKGDRIVLTGFKAGTFIRPALDQTFEIWNNGGAAMLNSFSDLDKIEDSLPVAGSVTADGDALIVINQGSAGVFTLLLDNIVGMPDGII
jgi:hypothetical protein